MSIFVSVFKLAFEFVSFLQNGTAHLPQELPACSQLNKELRISLSCIFPLSGPHHTFRHKPLAANISKG